MLLQCDAGRSVRVSLDPGTAAPELSDPVSCLFELTLAPGPQGVPAARAFSARALADLHGDCAADAELLITELVTNALLHGEPPIVLRLRIGADTVRVEVEDACQALPVLPRHSLDAMTGRGLALVAAVASRLGVERRGSDGAGKVVWAEIDRDRVGESPAEFDADALLDAWTSHAEDPARFDVRLGAVPTDLLLDAKSHIDNVVREMMLISGNDVAGLPPEMALVVRAVTEDFAEARTAIKQQALAAAARHEPFTDLALRLPLSAADAGERYLEALDEVDHWARAGRLLTMAPPAAHRAFRRWYVQALVDQLRAVGRGEQAPLPPLFPQVLAEEVNRLSNAAGTRPRPLPAFDRTITAGDLSEWRLSDTVRACSRLRTCADRAASMEEAARAVVTYFRAAFVDPHTDQPAFALVRLFKTEDLRNLPPELAERALEAAPQAGPGSRFLTLLGTAGDEPQWCHRRLSARHQVVPVVSAEAVAQAPMVSALVRQLGVGVDVLVHGAPEQQAVRGDFDVFHVEHAEGSEHVPDQQFVKEHGIRSVLGFGGLLPTGHVFAVVLFSRVRIPTATARLFRTVALSVKLALMRHMHSPVFSGTLVQPARRPIAADAQVLALEDVLEVHERTALEQAAALESRDVKLRREAEIVETLRHVGEGLSAVLDVDAVVQLTTTAAVDVTGAQFGAFFYDVAEEGGESSMRYTLAGIPADAFAAFPMPRNTPVFGPTFRGDGVVRSDDITKDPRYGKVGPHHGMPAGHLPVHSYLAAPVVSPTSGTVLGGLFLGHERTAVFDERAERLLVGIAAQTAIALDNATLYRRERETAVQLQQALLPGEPPQLPQLMVAHRYRPGTEGLHVGGDWYDVIALGEGRVALVIGDVMGRGVRAAATMGQLRTSIRAFASLDLAPAAIAERLNQIIVELPGDHIATFLYAVLDTEQLTLTWTSAGHLPPVLVEPHGGARPLTAELGPPLGIPLADFEEQQVELRPGQGLALFTDGLVESRTMAAEDGVAAVAALLAEATGDPEEVCDLLLTTFAGVSPEDDVALLYARVG